MYVIQKGTEDAPVVVIERADEALVMYPDLFVRVKKLAGPVSSNLKFQPDPDATPIVYEAPVTPKVGKKAKTQ